ncbi:MAG: hypothetical protein ACE5LH_05125 [Fidelibacterota bacterium]
MTLAAYVRSDIQEEVHASQNKYAVESVLNEALWRINAGSDTLANFERDGVMSQFDPAAKTLIVNTNTWGKAHQVQVVLRSVTSDTAFPEDPPTVTTASASVLEQMADTVQLVLDNIKDTTSNEILADSLEILIEGSLEDLREALEDLAESPESSQTLEESQQAYEVMREELLDLEASMQQGTAQVVEQSIEKVVESLYDWPKEIKKGTWRH